METIRGIHRDNFEIENAKAWLCQNFIFNHRTIYYSEPLEEMISLPPTILGEIDEFEMHKTNFKDPMEHMIAILFKLGRNLQSRDSIEALDSLCKYENIEEVEYIEEKKEYSK